MTQAAPRRVLGALAGLAVATVVNLTPSFALADDPAPAPRPWLAQAQTTTPAPQATPGPSGTLSWRASLLVLVSAGLGGAAVWVRGRKGKLSALTGSRELRVISTVRVGPKGHLVLAGVGDRAILLGVTDDSVRRIAWLPAEQLTTLAPQAPRAGENAERATSAANTTGAPTPRATPSDDSAHLGHKGGFAEILRKLASRPVDAAPPENANAATAALAIADLRGEDVAWSQGASHARAANKTTPQSSGGASQARSSEPAPSRSAKRHDSVPADMEQQAAGILKRRSRSRS